MNVIDDCSCGWCSTRSALRNQVQGSLTDPHRHLVDCRSWVERARGRCQKFCLFRCLALLERSRQHRNMDLPATYGSGFGWRWISHYFHRQPHPIATVLVRHFLDRAILSTRATKRTWVWPLQQVRFCCFDIRSYNLRTMVTESSKWFGWKFHHRLWPTSHSASFRPNCLQRLNAS